MPAARVPVYIHRTVFCILSCMGTRCIGCILQVYSRLSSSRLACHAIQRIQRIQPYSHTRHTSYSAIQPPSASCARHLGLEQAFSANATTVVDLTRRPNLEQGPSHAPAQPRCSTAGGRRELLCSAMLQPHAPAWQPLKVDSKAASDSHLPPRECSLGSGCAMDESQGVSTQSSTLRARGRAGKLTQVSFAVAQHGAAVPGCVRARS